MTTVKRGATTNTTLFFILPAMLLLAGMLLSLPSAHAALLGPSSQGFGGQTRSDNYDALIDALYANGNATTTIGDKLWVPWFRTSSSCAASDLQSGAACNSGETIDFTHNCMVTDEFSQVGTLVAMGDDQARMDQFYNTVHAIKSTRGQIPAWRVYRSGNTIEACRGGINGNCDTASDATARIIIALYTAGDNLLFTDSAQRARYSELASNLSRDFAKYELLYTCKPSSQNHGDICWWLAAGSGAKSGGMESTDFGYTGYYPDAIIAMLAACTQTDNRTYCEIAGNLTLNYLEAAKFDGTTFRVPPGRSFKWTNLSGIPAAQCTNTCNPDQWDGADAPRALGMCQANYYAQRINITLPRLQQYCQVWGTRYMDNPASAPYQYYSDGRNSASYQSGYFAQGMQALFQSGGHNPSLFAPTLDSALSHYSTSSKTWDNTACFGVYTQAFAVRALGMGIGRDEASFPPLGAASTSLPANLTNTTPVNATAPNGTPFETPVVNVTNSTTNATNQTTNQTIANGTSNSTGGTPYETPAANSTRLEEIGFMTLSPALPVLLPEPQNQTFLIAIDNPDAIPTTVVWYLNDVVQPAATNKLSYRFIGNYSAAGIWNITVMVYSNQNNITHTFRLNVTNTTPTVTASAANNTTSTNMTNSTGGIAQNTTQNSTQNASQNNTAHNATAGNTTQNVTAPNTTTTPNTTASNSEPVVQTPTPSRGGGGGGGYLPKKEQAGPAKDSLSSGSADAKDVKIKDAIGSYFSGDLPAGELVSKLRNYYGEP